MGGMAAINRDEYGIVSGPNAYGQMPGNRNDSLLSA